MNLINVYIQEITRWLPKKNKDSIVRELELTIYSKLPEDYDEEDVYQVLEDLGDPAILANKYSRKQMHLIGPKYYDLYVSLLKWIIPVAIIISLITIVGLEFINPMEDTASQVLTMIGEVLLNVITLSIHIFVWITVIFAIIERVDGKNDNYPKWMSFKSWDPKKLSGTYNTSKGKLIPTSEIYAGLVWTAIWGVSYFYADHLLGIYENGGGGVRMVTPAFNQEVLLSFWPIIVLLLVTEITLAIYKLIQKLWTKNMAKFYMIYRMVSVITFVFILTRPNLLSVDFLVKVSNVFNTTPAFVKSFIIWGGLILLIFFVINGIYSNFRKAYMNNKSYTQKFDKIS